MANKKHTQMNITFQVSFATPLNDDEVTDIMREMVMKKCKRINYYCEQWDSGTIKILSYADKK